VLFNMHRLSEFSDSDVTNNLKQRSSNTSVGIKGVIFVRSEGSRQGGFSSHVIETCRERGRPTMKGWMGKE
jgi:hypothetical protein